MTTFPFPPPPPPPAVLLRKAGNTCCGGVSDAMFTEMAPIWYYDWGIGCSSKAGIPQFPMVWGLCTNNIPRQGLAWLQANPTALDSCNRPVLGFNEPGNCTEPQGYAGSCMGLGTAEGYVGGDIIANWHLLESLLPNHELVSPAMEGPQHGPPYDLIQFIDVYHQTYNVYPRLNYIAQHYYGLGTFGGEAGKPYYQFCNARDHYLYLKAALAQRGYNVPIWITELGWWDTDATSTPAQIRAREFLNYWMQFGEHDSLCQYLNWFAPTQGIYTQVAPLYHNSALTLPGQEWVSWFGASYTLNNSPTTNIRPLILFNNYLYAGTGQSGQIWRSGDGIIWNLVFDSTETSIEALEVFNGYLYAGTANNGKIYRSSNGTSWTEVSGSSPYHGTIYAFKVFGSYIYAGTYGIYDMLRSLDGVTWSAVPNAPDAAIHSFAVFNSYLYAGTSMASGGKIYRSSNGTSWTLVYSASTASIYALETFGSYIYAGTSPSGKIYRSNNGTSWSLVYDLGDSQAVIRNLTNIDNAFLYACISPYGTIHRSSDGVNWNLICNLNNEEGGNEMLDYNDTAATSTITTTSTSFVDMTDMSVTENHPQTHPTHPSL